MRKDAEPSDYFLGAIRRGYDAEERSGKTVTCSGIWDHVCMECLRRQGGFNTMFAWDNSKAKSINRIGTIQECIERELVPGLRLLSQGRGLIVVRC
jgi:hypothetical protein